MTKIVFLDTETTGLRPDRRVWDIGLIVRDEEGRDVELQWYISIGDLDLGNADPFGLKIGRFYERHPEMNDRESTRSATYSEETALSLVERATRDAIVVGAVPNFDTEVIGERMRWNNIAPSWHYHLVDVETLAAGALGYPPPWNFDALLNTWGLSYDEADRHTALGDARMVRDLYDAVMKSVRLARVEAGIEAGK